MGDLFDRHATIATRAALLFTGASNRPLSGSLNPNPPERYGSAA